MWIVSFESKDSIWDTFDVYILDAPDAALAEYTAQQLLSTEVTDSDLYKVIGVEEITKNTVVFTGD